MTNGSERPAHSGVALMCQWADKAVAHTRLLKKAHLRHPSSGWVPGALARRCDVRTKYASHLHPSCGWVPGAPPCIWTFLSSLAENQFFSILLERDGDRALTPGVSADDNSPGDTLAPHEGTASRDLRSIPAPSVGGQVIYQERGKPRLPGLSV